MELLNNLRDKGLTVQPVCVMGVAT